MNLYLVQSDVCMVPHKGGRKSETRTIRLVYANDADSAIQKFEQHYKKIADEQHAWCTFFEMEVTEPIV
jgi:hypothetical protein